jgi:uncharacterized protein YecE (DUF72 family)
MPDHLIPENGNDHERGARVHPASPSLTVAVRAWSKDHAHKQTAMALRNPPSPLANTHLTGVNDKQMTAKSGPIYIGIGGWTFEPWRGEFYPRGLPHAKELAYAAERLTSIEVNGTFYRTQTPATFRKWASEVPKHFKFSLKGPRFATNRRVLKEAGDSIKRFLDSGVTELGDRLGPLLWQFAPTKKFDPTDFGGFLELLPAKFAGQMLRHVIEVRHDSFRSPEFIALLRKFDMPVVYTDHVRYPNLADLTGKFVYARLQRGKDTVPTAYAPKEIKSWAARLRDWADGKQPSDLPCVAPVSQRKATPREIFAYVIHEGKIRAPAGAIALIAAVGAPQ